MRESAAVPTSIDETSSDAVRSWAAHLQVRHALGSRGCTRGLQVRLRRRRVARARRGGRLAELKVQRPALHARPVTHHATQSVDMKSCYQPGLTHWKCSAQPCKRGL